MKTALYARVSSDRQDVDLSISAQLRALRAYAEKNGHQVVKEYVDEAETGRTTRRPVFQQMVRDARVSSGKAFEGILVWKLSRFARNREDSIAYKALLRKHNVKVVSITEPFEETPTGRLLEAIVESLDEFYSANLGQEIHRGMRESASRGFYVSSRAPYGYRRVKVRDGKKDRAKLEVDNRTAGVVRRMFSLFLEAQGLKPVVKALNAEGISSPTGTSWSKTVVHKVLVNEAYTGTLVWGKGGEDEPVRVEGAWEGLVDKKTFSSVQSILHSRGFKKVHPRRTASTFMLSGLVKCNSCGKALVGQDAKSGKFSYYVCGTLMRQGAGACDAAYLPREKFEAMVVEKLRSHILVEDHLRELVELVGEEMDGTSAHWRERLDTLEAELADVKRRLGRLYEALEAGLLSMHDLSPRIHQHRHRQEQLEAALEETRDHISERKQEILDLETVTKYVGELRELLGEGSLVERRAFIKTFVQEIRVAKDEAVIRYTLPLPPDDVSEERAGVLSIVPFGGAGGTRTFYLPDAASGRSPR